MLLLETLSNKSDTTLTVLLLETLSNKSALWVALQQKKNKFGQYESIKLEFFLMLLEIYKHSI